MGGVGAILYGMANLTGYVRKKKSGGQALKDTVKDSAGLGLSAGLGVMATNAIAGSVLAFGSTVLVPIAAGVTTTYITKRIWNGVFWKTKPRGGAE